MYIQDLPEGLVNLVKQKLTITESAKKETIKEEDKKKAEEVVINPSIDSPHSVQTR